MAERHSTAPVPSNKPGKPAKPFPEFPLFAHATGRWAKKIRGRMVYFGPWSDPDGALAKYEAEKEALHAGRKPREVSTGVTVRDLANAFLNLKRERVESGELAARTFADYKAAADLAVDAFGKGRLAGDLDPDDFAELRAKMTRKWGPVRVRDFIQRIRSVFKHGYEAGLIATPMRFGPGFARPSRKTMRLLRAKQGPNLFTPPQIRALLRKASKPIRAMLLLGINCGFGNADCGTLPMKALDLAGGWVNYPRPKTGTPRRCPLWPETTTAIRQAMDQRPEPKDPADAELVFLTRPGAPWHKEIGDSPVSKEVAKLLKELKLYRGNRRGLYTLRHCFETVGGETRDQVAVDLIMGHSRNDMATVYREKVSDERLRAVVNHVRGWLFSAAAVE